MNIKEWIFPLTFAIAMTYAIQYYFEPRVENNFIQNQIKSGSGFFAPSVQDVNKPLVLDVLYQEQEQVIPVAFHVVKTSCGSYVFSNKGAVLESFSFPWHNVDGDIKTILADENCFLVALEKNTPLMYSFVNVTNNEISGTQSIVYQAEFNGGIITKTFTLYNSSYQIDLDISIQEGHNPFVNSPLQARIFIAEPVMQPVIHGDKISGVVNSQQGNSLTTIDVSKNETLKKYWAMPNFFGYESRFIVHAMVKDENNFVQRAYMKKNASGYLAGILESRLIDASGTWKISFFVGPKTAQAMAVVDNRLLQTLNFGWLSPISHPILSFLNYLQEKIGNYGWAIILLTLLMKLLLLPFTLYTEKSMRKGFEMQKKMDYLQKKYKNDPEQLEKERMELIKKHGMPGIGGCLPLLLTLPVFVALNSVLSNAIELYGASFLWITNLYAVDPYYILPILTGLVMLAAPADKDPKKNAMRYAMALLMATVTSYWSAGLVLFILINSATASLQASLQKR